jgi:hypothetical protein
LPALAARNKNRTGRRNKTAGVILMSDIYTFSLPPSLGLEPLFANPAQNQARLSRDKGNDKTTHSLSPSSLGLEKNSLHKPSRNTNAPLLIKGKSDCAMCIKAHSLSPSSLGLEKTLFANPARIRARRF